jgi:hypothetical protein
MSLMGRKRKAANSFSTIRRHATSVKRSSAAPRRVSQSACMGKRRSSGWKALEKVRSLSIPNQVCQGTVQNVPPEVTSNCTTPRTIGVKVGNRSGSSLNLQELARWRMDSGARQNAGGLCWRATRRGISGRRDRQSSGWRAHWSLPAFADRRCPLEGASDAFRKLQGRRPCLVVLEAGLFIMRVSWLRDSPWVLALKGLCGQRGP